jgi:NAD(P)-dependent dehydrogenase (short-subunit alcohol dehydrogenase family)
MKTVIITGAGTGMGSATAQVLAEHSDLHLVLIGRRADKIEAVRAALPNPEKHTALSVDIADRKALREALAGLASIEQRDIFAIFANAGIGGENHYGDDDRWHEIITTNLTGTYYSIMETLPYLRKSKQAFKHILMTSSCLARFGVPNYTAYCTSKTGLLGLTRSLAVELASERILVNALCPGWVETEMAQAGIQLLADRAGQPYQETYDQQMGFVPLGRMSLPQEVAHLVDFLFSGKQVSMTGQGIDINNGSWMQ